MVCIGTDGRLDEHNQIPGRFVSFDPSGGNAYPILLPKARRKETSARAHGKYIGIFLGCRGSDGAAVIGKSLPERFLAQLRLRGGHVMFMALPWVFVHAIFRAMRHVALGPGIGIFPYRIGIFCQKNTGERIDVDMRGDFAVVCSKQRCGHFSGGFLRQQEADQLLRDIRLGLDGLSELGLSP